MSQVTFFSLPVELRLQIVSYVFEELPLHASLQSSDDTISSNERKTERSISWPQLIKSNQQTYTNLSLLLVCRQFRQDFTTIAFQTARFVIKDSVKAKTSRLPAERLCNIKRLGIDCEWDELTTWESFPFNEPRLHLDELWVTIRVSFETIEVVTFLRRLQNVKVIKFIRAEETSEKQCEYLVSGLVVDIIKEDHHQRYEAPDAPNVEMTEWDWQMYTDGIALTCIAQEAKPIMSEEEYNLYMKARVQKLMCWETHMN